MITEAVVFLRDEVRRYLLEDGAITATTEVVLGNIAAAENHPALGDRLVLSVVNIEEESALKNGKYINRITVTNGLEILAPPVYLNLYLLFCATLSETADDDDYRKALQRITSVVELFQFKRTFTVQNSPGFEPTNLHPRLLTELRLHPELYSMTFEQINHLWGTLGGKQSPFVMYKVRLVKIQSLIPAEAPLIETIDMNVLQSVHGSL